jgi:PAS domain S-box-containing protein
MLAKERTEALQTFDILNKEMQQELSGLTELASKVCKTPISLVNVLDSSKQFTKASKGWDIQQMPKGKSFCQYTILDQDLMIVEDTLEDERFKNSEFVQGDPKIRFYAGAPLTTNDGINLGSLCAIDTKPKKLSESQKGSLRLIANEVMARFTLYKREKELKAQNKELLDAGIFLQNSSDIQAIIDPESKKISWINEEAAQLIEFDTDELLGKEFASLIVDEDERKQSLTFLDQRDVTEGEFSVTITSKRNAKKHLRCNFTYYNDKWYVTARDITKRKQAKKNLDRERKISDRIINNLPNNFFMYDEDGNCIRWNNKFSKSTGYGEQEIAYMGPVDYFLDTQKELIKQKISQVFEKGEAQIEATLVTKHGKEIPYLFSVARLIDQQKTYLLGIGQDLSEQKKYQNKIETSLKEKETLLSEIHHRVKNNLAIISGLLRLESFQSENEHTQEVLKDSQLRIQSMFTVHEMLYQSSSFNDLSFGDFVENIVRAIKDTFPERVNEIEFQFDVEPLQLNINQAVPCGLILNELITNAYKHAYPDTEGIVNVSIKKQGDQVTMVVEDNGVGIPEKISISQPATLGLTLINNLLRQLYADLSINNEQGTKVEVKFTKEDIKGSGSSMGFA